MSSTSPISKYLSEIISSSHIILTYNNPNKDFKSVKATVGSRENLNKIEKDFQVGK